MVGERSLLAVPVTRWPRPLHCEQRQTTRTWGGQYGLWATDVPLSTALPCRLTVNMFGTHFVLHCWGSPCGHSTFLAFREGWEREFMLHAEKRVKLYQPREMWVVEWFPPSGLITLRSTDEVISAQARPYSFYSCPAEYPDNCSGSLLSHGEEQQGREGSGEWIETQGQDTQLWYSWSLKR